MSDIEFVDDRLNPPEVQFSFKEKMTDMIDHCTVNKLTTNRQWEIYQIWKRKTTKSHDNIMCSSCQSERDKTMDEMKVNQLRDRQSE